MSSSVILRLYQQAGNIPSELHKMTSATPQIEKLDF